MDEMCGKDHSKDKKKKKKKIEENTLNEKVNLQFRISPKGMKMRMVKTLDQALKDYTREEIKDANIDVVVNGEVIGSFDGAKLSYRVM
jgi:hypothetical protein